MKTIRMKIYKFSELSKEARKTALENWIYKTDYFWSDDSLTSLKKFAEHFHGDLTDYSIDWTDSSPSYVKFYAGPYEYEDYSSRYYEDWLKEKIESMGSYNKETLKGLGDCKFTGYCADEDAADGARQAYYSGERDLNEILMAGFHTWYKACVSDYESQQTEEYFSEHADANEYWFTENGKRFF